MRNCMAWTTLFMVTCRKEKTIQQKDNWITWQLLKKYTPQILKLPMPLQLSLQDSHWKTTTGKRHQP